MTESPEISLGKISDLIELLRYRAARQPHDVVYTFLRDGETEEAGLTYYELDLRAKRIAARLQSVQGERALLFYPPGLEYITAFFGCLYAGVTAVPVYPPHPARLARTLPRLRGIAKSAQPSAALTTSQIIGLVELMFSQDPDFGKIRWLATDKPLEGTDEGPASEWQKPDVSGETLAFLQYTSGSTGSPKGVMVSHENLLCNLALIHECFGFGNTPETRLVVWLPPYHDMGLVGGILQPLYAGFPVILMSPVSFLQKPIRWLQAISRYQATTSGGPNFAYELCLRKITPEQKVGLDLSSWKTAFNGSEPVRPDTLKRFAAAFELCGFRESAFYPCYGLAEATLIVSGGSADAPPVFRDILTDPLKQHQAILASGKDKDKQTLVGSGKNLHTQDIRLVNPQTLRQCRPDEIGEIWVSGRSVAQGYWGKPDETRKTFQAHLSDTGEGPFLRTGDLGFLLNGEMFITGRHKDLIVIRGRNYYPQDIELTVERSHPRLRPGCCAAFGVEVEGEERLVVVTEVERRFIADRRKSDTGHEKERREENRRQYIPLPEHVPEDQRPLKTEKAIEAIRRAIAERHELQIHAILLIKVGSIPKTTSGKIQRHACKSGFLDDTLDVVAGGVVAEPEVDIKDFPSREKLEAVPQGTRQKLLESHLRDLTSTMFKDVLDGKKVGVHDNFFEIGGNSLLLVRLQNKIQEIFDKDVPVVNLFRYPTISDLAQYLSQQHEPENARFSRIRERVRRRKETVRREPVAIIGMAGRFPGAKDIQVFWENLRQGKESISFFTDDELTTSGADPALMRNPAYVRAGGILDDVDLFDAPFFGISPAEARLLDPQLRLFLECAYQTFEHAGYDPQTYPGRIGLFAGSAVNTYLVKNLMNSGLDMAKSWNNDQAIIYSDTNYLTTRTAYTLNLKGPILSVSTACSTSLVAVHLACQSLLNQESDMVLAGGVAVIVPQKEGYLYEGGTRSPDGRCRAFDAKSQGTLFTSGMGSLLLKRLGDALKDGDQVHAVIQGTAVNNDGGARAGYAAPGVEGQAEVIAEAQAMAEIDLETVTYIEAHGTGTTLGDPIEIEALTQAFREKTQKTGFCAIGSVKTNVGHLNMAAGVTGIIKTVLGMKHQMIPPSLNFESPNPRIDFEKSPFFVNTTLSEWKPPDNIPRRAGVSSFGVGGTNAHVILEEAPDPESAENASDIFRTSASRPYQLLALSAKTGSALEKMTANLAGHFREHPDLDLADAAHTLLTGRRLFSHRRFLVCQDANDAVSKLTGSGPGLFTGTEPTDEERPVIFMFSGQGSQYVNMGRELYQNEPIFRGQVDLCSELLKLHVEFDIRDMLYPGEGHPSPITPQPSPLTHTEIAQPALFVVEYALARLWMAWGIRPRAMIGHSIGEYVAACLAGVLSLEDALGLVADRGQMMGSLPKGAMLAIPLPEEDVRSLLKQGVSLAVVNGPSQCVVSGHTEAVEDIQNDLTQRGVQCRLLHTSHAFHSEMTEPILKPFTDHFRKVMLRPPHTPYISNVTGTWITGDETTDPEYWARHLRQTVRFADGIRQLAEESDPVLLEVGPGQTLTTLVMRQGARGEGQGARGEGQGARGKGPSPIAPHPSPIALNSIRHPRDSQSDMAFLLTTLGKLWLAGVRPVWSSFYAQERRHRIPLPSYPFERRRYWVEPIKTQGVRGPGVRGQGPGVRQADMADWFHVPSWKRVPLPGSVVRDQGSEAHPVLLFSDEYGLGERVAKDMEQNGQEVVSVKKGSKFDKLSPISYTLNPEHPEDYESLMADLHASDKSPETILHLWAMDEGQEARGEGQGASGEGQALMERLDQMIRSGFDGLQFLAQAIGEGQARGRREASSGESLIAHSPPIAHSPSPLALFVISDNMQEVTGTEDLRPEKAMMLGLVRWIPKAYPHIMSRSIDFEGVQNLQFCALPLLSEISHPASDPVVAYRGPHRWVQTFEPIRLEPVPHQFRPGGTYLITEGLGDIGYGFAEYLARTVQAKLALVESSELPSRGDGRWAMGDGDDRLSITDCLLPLAPRPLPLPVDMGTESEFIRARASELEKFLDIREIGSYKGLQESIDTLCASHTFDYFRACGVETEKGRRHTREELSGQLKIMPKFEKFLDFFIRVLAEDDIIQVEDETVRFLKGRDEVTDSETLAKEAEARYPDFKEMSQFLNHCVRHYPEALSGKTEAISVLFPEGKSDRVENFAKNMADHSNSQVCMDLLRDLTLMISEKSGKKLRILEVGAGTGDLTWEMAAALTGRDVEYHFTDIGKSFVVKAERDAAKRGFNFMKCGTLDISSDPTAQGYDPRSFDMIFGLNVVHATKRIRETLGHLRSLLVPGGIIALVESIKPLRPVDMVWGVAEGWWYFEDEEIRRESPLMAAEKWEQVMRDMGFVNVKAYPDDEARRAQADLALIIAQEECQNEILAEQEECQNEILADRITQIRVARAKRLESLGSEILPLCADLTDLDQMESALKQINETFGPVHGVIHASGMDWPTCNFGTQDANRERFGKARGAVILDTLFRDQGADFLTYCSSLSSLTGQGSLSDCAENAFLDALVHCQSTTRASGHQTLSISRNGGMPEGGTRMTQEEGMESFCRALFSSSSPHVIISPYDFEKADDLQVGTPAPDSSGVATDEASSTDTAHPRPDLGNTYAAPGTEIEKTLARIWQEVLSIEQVGIHDNFFELGGDSLIATQVISRVREAFQVEVSPENLFENPTVAGVAERIETIRWAMDEPNSETQAEEVEEGEI